MQVPLFTSSATSAKNTSKVVFFCGIWGLYSSHADKTVSHCTHLFRLLTLTGSAHEVLRRSCNLITDL